MDLSNELQTVVLNHSTKQKVTIKTTLIRPNQPNLSDRYVSSAEPGGVIIYSPVGPDSPTIELFHQVICQGVETLGFDKNKPLMKVGKGPSGTYCVY